MGTEEKMIKAFFRRHRFLLLTILLTVSAFGCRFVYCHWGYPLQLQPDEHAIVVKAIDMLSRHSWEADQYNRPDHFEIKCNSIIFAVLSRLKFHKPAYEAFPEHTGYFYLRARYFTAVFGTALVPLVSWLAALAAASLERRYRRIIQFFAMFFTAFPELFIENSSYATPDIVLTFFVVLFSCFSLRYLQCGAKKYLYYCMVIIGIGITIKYPAAILLIPYSGMFLYREFIYSGGKRRWTDIPKYAAISFAVIFFTVFIIAPNLITNMEMVIKTFRMEARDFHVGADGLGFWGNLKFYFTFIAKDLGTISMVPFFIGLAYVLIKREREFLVLLIGVIYWLCMSVLSLHWVRWGIPMFIFYNLVTSIGIAVSFRTAEAVFREKRPLRIAASCGLMLFCALLVVNISLYAAAKVKYSTIPDTRYITMKEMPERGITAKNSAFESYTPFAANGSGANADINSFHFTDSGLEINIEHALKQYYVMTDSYRDRYFAAPDRYPKQVALYNALDQTYGSVYSIEADGNLFLKGDVFENIALAVRYLRARQTGIGVDMKVYDLDPHPVYVTVFSADGSYMAVDDSEIDMDDLPDLTVSEEPFLWAYYELDDEHAAFLSSVSGLAVDVPNGSFVPGRVLRLFPGNGNPSQRWEIRKSGSYVFLVGDEEMALTRDRDRIIIEPLDMSEDQQWLLNFH